MCPTAARRAAPALALAAAILLAGCGTTGAGPATTTAPPAPPPATAPPPPATTAPTPAPEAAPRPAAPSCPAGEGNCTAASGRVIALESVDADGDGDLHLVLASRQSVTLPGITVLDINKDLRPAADPHVGDWAAGAGPVYPGSYGQHQIQVEQVVYSPTRP